MEYQMRDLSILIPARNEMFLGNTVSDILEHIEGNTEIIVVLDGQWPVEPLPIHERVTVVHLSESIGQRAALNLAAKLSKAKFIMKVDAHCSFDQGFDVKLMADCEYDWTIVPRMYNLHVFDWVCECGNRTYQGPTKPCGSCGKEMRREIVWRAKPSPETDHMRFDSSLKFQYWSEFKSRPEAKGDLAPTMSILGACFFMHRERYWELGGSDEEHGSWGQQGTEIACKTWLSGGQLLVNKKTWFAHMFRTQGGDFGFPYPLSSSEVDKARQHSRELWLGGQWPKAKHDIDWLLNKFAPVPGWQSKGVIYYTDNRVNMKIARAVRKQISKSGLPIVSASLKPLDFGKNIHIQGKRGYLTMFKQILAALEASDSEIVFFCEHDVLYHPSHFEFIPKKKDVYYYNTNVWKVRASDGHALRVDDCRQLSGLCGYRETLITHFRKRIELVETIGFSRKMGFEPGTHSRKERVDDLKSETWESELPNMDIRHDKNLTDSRWTKEEFRDQRYTRGWKEATAESVPGWPKGLLS